MDCLPHLHIAAIHAEPGYKVATPGLGVLCRKDDLLSGAGVLSNSHGKTSFYAMAGWQPLQIGPVRLGVVGGVINGYPYHDGGFMPMVAGVASVGNWHLTMVPAIKNFNAASVSVSYTWDLRK